MAMLIKWLVRCLLALIGLVVLIFIAYRFLIAQGIAFVEIGICPRDLALLRCNPEPPENSCFGFPWMPHLTLQGGTPCASRLARRDHVTAGYAPSPYSAASRRSGARCHSGAMLAARRRALSSTMASRVIGRASRRLTYWTCQLTSPP